MRSAIRPLALLAVACLPVLPAAAAPSAGAEEAAAAAFPLVTPTGTMELHLVAERERLVLDLYDEAGLQRATLPLQDGQLVLTPDGATLEASVDGVPLQVTWKRVEGHVSIGTGAVTGGGTGASYRGAAGDYSNAALQLTAGECPSQWGSLGRSPHAATDDAGQGEVAALAALLRSAGCGESTSTSIPPEGR